MSAINFLEAKEWISTGAPVSYDQDHEKFVKGDWRDKIHRFFSGDYE